MSLDDSAEKLALLREIRDEMRGLEREVHQGLARLLGDIHGSQGKVERAIGRLDGMVAGMHRGLDRIDVALAEYAEQVRLTVHYVRVLAKQSGIEIDPV